MLDYKLVFFAFNFYVQFFILFFRLSHSLGAFILGPEMTWPGRAHRPVGVGLGVKKKPFN